MTGFYKDYADSSDTHQNSAEASADAAEVSANEAAASASEAATSASEAATSLAAQEDLEVTSVTFSSSTGVLSLTKPNETISADLDGRYAELSGDTFTGDIVLNGAELISNSNLDFRVDADNNDTTSSFRVFNDNNVSASFEVNSLGNVFIDSSGLYDGVPRDHNKLAIGDMAVTSASTAPLGIQANSSFQTLALQSNDNSSTVKFNVLDNGTLSIGTPATTNLSLSYSGDLSVNGDSTFNGSLTVDTDTLHVDATNNRVGINTPTPYSPLTVNNDGTEYRIYPEGLITDGTLVSSYIPESSMYGSIYTRASLHRWGIGTDEKMRIDDTGYVGIGTNSPISPLQVSGTIYAEGGTFDPPDDGNPPSGSDSIDNVAFVMPRGNKIGFWTDGYFRTLLQTDTSGVVDIGQIDTAYITGIKLNCGASGSVTIKNSNANAGLTVEGSLTSSNITYPTTDGTNGQVIVTDGNGNLSFTDQSGGGGGIGSSGGTFTGDVLFNDGVKAKFGTDSDLLIYHNNGEPSVIEDAGELGLILKTNGNIFAVASDTNETMITATPNGGVSLYHDNNVKLTVGENSVNINEHLSVSLGKDLNVSGGDLNVTGDIAVSGSITGANFSDAVSFGDNIKAKFGDDDDLLIYHNTTGSQESVIEDTGTGGLQLRSNGNGVFLKSETQNIISAYAPSGSPSSASLFYNNVEKLKTINGGVDVTGNIVVSGNVDGRNLYLDGVKLDNLLYKRTSDAHLHSFASTTLSTASKTFGKCFSLATPFDCVRFADVQFEITYNASTSNNDVLFSLGLVVPSGIPTVHNLGTATQITDSDYPYGYADRWFSLDGDKTHLFSRFCGVADTSSPVSPTYVYSWVYRADLDKTYFNCGIFANNAIGDGDTVYLHPFDWESAGTVIQVTLNMDGTTAYGGLAQMKGFRIKTAYDDSRLEYRVIAREASTTDSATLRNINVVMTDYEV